MKRFSLLAISFLALISASCTAELTSNEPADNTVYITRTYQAGIGETTKAAIDASGKVSWSAGDVIRYYSESEGAIGECTVAEDCDKANLTMSLAEDASFMVAVYGGTSLSGNTGKSVTINGAIPAEQSGVFGENHVTAVKTYDVKAQTLTFHNIASYIKFTLSRTDVAKVVFSSNDGTAISGNGEVVMTFSAEEMTAAFGSNKTSSITVNNGGAGTYYIATLPCTMAGGFKADCYDAEGAYLGSAVTSKSVEVKSGTILNLGTIDSHIEKLYTDLSAAGTANCYIVPEVGCYKFKATVKGSSTELIDGTPYKAKVLWESFGTDVTPTVGDIVSDVTYKDGYIQFTSGLDGNAVIAIKDRDDEILWSWHIWICEGYVPAATDQVYNNNAGTMMDRNLGATSATPGDVGALGLLYQWGRKDPFLGGNSISYSGFSELAKAASTVGWPSAVASNSSNGKTEYAVAHPTTFITYNESNYDWYYTGGSSTDDTRWQSSSDTKGLYDPCPSGYRVPDGGSTGVWSKAFGTSNHWETTSNWDSTNMGMDFGHTDKTLGSGTIWYPASGWLDGDSGVLCDTGYSAFYFSCNATISNCSAYGLRFYPRGYINPSNRFSRGDGQSVRCCKDTYVGPQGTDLSANGTANCYIVSEAGDYKIQTVKGNSNESVGAVVSAEVLWESFGSSTAPSVGDLVSDASYYNGYITFKASDKKGNAVIAAKDADGNILWSWHIWMTDQPEDQVYNNNAGTMMDRNLGATSASKGDVCALGLLYQWGRKDPFMGGASISSNTRSASTCTWPSAVLSDASTGTIEYTIANPTTYIKRNSKNFDWHYNGGSSKTDKTRWQSTKTIHDPCPAGYRVPDGGSTGIWAKAFGTGEAWKTPSNWDSTNKGMDFNSTDKTLGNGVIWYPAPGIVSSADGVLYLVGTHGRYWSCTSSDDSSYYAYHFDLSESYFVNPSSCNSLAVSQSVRCCKE